MTYYRVTDEFCTYVICKTKKWYNLDISQQRGKTRQCSVAPSCLFFVERMDPAVMAVTHAVQIGFIHIRPSVGVDAFS